MSTTIERLLIVQDRDRKLAQLTREIEDIPARQKEIESRLSAHRAALDGAHEEIKKNTASTKQIEVEVDARKQRIAKFREQQFQIKSNVEYKALEHEIAMVQKEIGDLEDRELVVMEQTETLRAQMAAREKDLQQEQGRVTADLDVLRKRMEQVQGEIHDLKTDREALARDIDAAMLSRYERILRKTGDFAIVPIENNACGGCHMNLPPQVIHDTRKNLSLTQCSFCGRILYWQP